MNYLFTLGRTFSLCKAELVAILKINNISYKTLHQIENHIIIETEKEIESVNLIKQSGGIIKIGKILAETNDYTKIVFNNYNENNQVFEAFIDKNEFKNFGVSIIAFQADAKVICEELKKQIKLHYVLPKKGTELSSAQVLTQKILEIVVVKIGKDRYQVFKTQAVQDINYWTKKDVKRPNIDDKLGMLPLKVARIMLNLALSSVDNATTINNKAILDPFCGMGSILQESIDLGMKNINASDINVNVLKKCSENLNWFVNKFGVQDVIIKTYHSDAAKISQMLGSKIDIIVTEPFLGNARKLQKLNDNQNGQNLKNAIVDLKNILKGLEKMYLGCLKDWKKILTDNFAICIIVPEIKVKNQVYTIQFVEICEKLGYNIIGNYEYSREKAVVKRKIYLLTNNFKNLI